MTQSGLSRSTVRSLPIGAALRCLRAYGVVLSSLFLFGCSDDDFADLQQYVTEVKSRKKDAVPPLPEVRTFEPFVFRGDLIKDPFRRAEREEAAGVSAECSANRPDPARPKEALESYELDELRMVGTLRRSGELWALVRAKDDTIHRVRAGNYLGRRLGRIVAVKPDRIDLVEQVEQRECVWEERRAALDLSDAGERR